MSQILKKENIYFKNKVETWQEAIQVAIFPLIAQGYCEKKYVDAILENTKKYGPYYVLCEDMALIHADSKQGVIDTQIAITILSEPIKFKENGYDVRVLIALAAKDSFSHMSALKIISQIFMDEHKKEILLQSHNSEDIFNLFEMNL